MFQNKNTKIIEKLIQKTMKDEYSWVVISDVFLNESDEFRNSQHLVTYRSYVQFDTSEDVGVFYLLTYRAPINFITKTYTEELSLVFEFKNQRKKIEIDDTYLLYALRSAIEVSSPSNSLDSKLDDFLES